MGSNPAAPTKFKETLTAQREVAVTKKREDNLRPCEYKLTQDEAKKGGKNSAESRRQKKLFREALEELLSMPVTNEGMKKNLAALGIAANRQTKMKTALAAAMIKEAYNGNVKAFIAIRDTLGEKPEENINLSGDLAVDIPKNIQGLSLEELRALCQEAEDGTEGDDGAGG